MEKLLLTILFKVATLAPTLSTSDPLLLLSLLLIALLTSALLRNLLIHHVIACLPPRMSAPCWEKSLFCFPNCT